MTQQAMDITTGVLELDFWKSRGRYSKKAIRNNAVIDHRPIEAGDPEPVAEEEKS